jgi:hypothetical protein
MDDFETFSSTSVTSFGVCSFSHWWLQLWSLSVSVVRRYSCPFACPACLWILCSTIWARMASGHIVLMNYSQLSFHLSFPLIMPRKLNTLILLFPDLGMRILDHVLSILSRGGRNSAFHNFTHIQGQVQVRLFQLYTTSLSCHCSRHVEYLNHLCFRSIL